MQNVREINPEGRTEFPQKPEPTIWQIEHPDSTTRRDNIRFPAIGLDDGWLLAPTGKRDHIGPTYDGPARWHTISEALNHFNRVHDNLCKLACGQPLGRTR